MGLNLALNNALSGLKVNQQSMEVLSQNLANANTPGYSRHVVQQSAVVIQGVGSGVQIDDVVRKVDDYLLRAVQTQTGQVQQTSIVNDYQGRVQTLLGSPGAGNSISDYLTNFTNALQQLSDAPDSVSNRSAVVSSATTLATQISNLAGSLQDLRFQSEQDMKTAVDDINQQIGKLNNLNKAIASAAVSHQSTAGLLDERDQALQALGQHFNVTASFDKYGVATVIAGNGVGLVDGLNHQVVFKPSSSADSFNNDQTLSPLSVLTLDSKGNQVAPPADLITGGTSDQVTSQITSGDIAGLQQIRDHVLPGMVDELDMLASNMRDAMNAISNAGTAFPPPNSLTGTRQLHASDEFDWSGSARIAALQADGTPVPSPFADQPGGWPALTLNFASLDSGDGNGRPTVQTIINEINNHYKAPTAKVELGNLNNIQLASDSNSIPPSQFNFDFDLQNLSGGNAQFFVTGVSVKNDAGGDITNVTQGPPSIALRPDMAYQTQLNSSIVTLTLQSQPGLKVGDTVYLGPPGGATVNGINAANLTGYKQVLSVNGNQITVDAGQVATGTGNVVDNSGVAIQPPFNVPAGQQLRTKDEGQMQVDLSAGSASTFFDITATVAVVQPDGTVKNSQVTYRVPNAQRNILNQRYDVTNATADGTRVLPNTTQDALHAIMVDANGNELPKDSNGQYIGVLGYLEIVGGTANDRVAIDSMDSSQLGQLNTSPAKPGTKRGFSYFFELNNFFDSNAPTATGDTVKNSAIHLKVAGRLAQDPNLVTSGQITLVNQPTDPTQSPYYSYQLYPGDNTNASQFAAINNQNISFGTAGDLPQISVTLGGYTSSILSSMAAGASAAKSVYTNANTLLQGLQSQASAVSGVNIDEELANTVTYQNAYTATARIVTVVNQMYQELFNMIG